MNRDGKDKFYSYLNIDKSTMKLLYFFRELKQDMSRGKDDYINGKVYTNNEDN
jgi:hypothetical protein